MHTIFFHLATSSIPRVWYLVLGTWVPVKFNFAKFHEMFCVLKAAMIMCIYELMFNNRCAHSIFPKGFSFFITELWNYKG